MGPWHDNAGVNNPNMPRLEHNTEKNGGMPQSELGSRLKKSGPGKGDKPKAPEIGHHGKNSNKH